MIRTKLGSLHRVLLVEDDQAVREIATETLQHKGFDAVSTSDVKQALKLIATESFDALLTSLHMLSSGNGFTVVSPLRHSQLDSLTRLVSACPDVSATNAILMEAGKIIVKPSETWTLADLIHGEELSRKPSVPEPKERVAVVSQHCTSEIVDRWLAGSKKSNEIHVALSDKERTCYLPQLIEDLIVRLRASGIPGDESLSICSAAAVAYGKMRKAQGYTPAMLVHDSRILQLTLFATMQRHLSGLDFSLVLPDVMTIADEVDWQLTQAVDSFTNVAGTAAAA